MARQHHQIRRRTTTRAATAIALALLAALVAAGCGSDDDDGGSGTSGTSTDATPEIRDVTSPKVDPELIEDLGTTAATLTDAGCSFGTYKERDAEHVDDDADLFGKDFPPTSGDHYGDWAPFGLYDQPIADGNVVHNLEHGAVVAWLGTKVDEPTTDAIADLLDDEEKWIVAPRPDIEGLFSAAWATGLSCPPAALAKLGADGTADALDEWYEVVNSTGSEAEKDVPAYAGAMKEPSPTRDISAKSPF